MTATEHRITINFKGPSAKVHLRRSQHVDIDARIAKSSIDAAAAITDIKARAATRCVRSKV
jgi:hypothetical protein